jgi:thiol:disulfide interchange protein
MLEVLAGAALLIAIAWFVVALLIAVWLYKDAEKRGQSGVLWLIIALIAGIFGLIVWLLVRPPIQTRAEKKRRKSKRKNER